MYFWRHSWNILRVWSQAKKKQAYFLALLMLNMQCTTRDGRNNSYSLTSDHHSRGRDAYIIWFSRNLSWLDQWHFAELITEKTSHDKVITKRWSLKYHQACIRDTDCLCLTYDYHNWVRDVEMDFVLFRFLYDIDSDILRHWLWIHRKYSRNFVEIVPILFVTYKTCVTY